MKIVEFCNYTGPAKDSMGSERVVESLTKAFLRLGHEVVMFVNSDSTNMPAPVIDKIPDGFDIIHAHGAGADILDKYNLPWVSTVHGGGSDPINSPWHNNQNFICVSDYICKISNNVQFVHSCVDPDDFIYKDKKENYFAWLAGTDWGEGKGLFTAINLAKKLKFRLKIAGIGKNRHIIDAIKSFCDNKIEYVGAVNGAEKANFLANAKALLFYSKLSDACPLTIAESFISGTPVIGSTNGSLPELIVHNKTGFLCSDEVNLAKAVANIGKISPEDCRKYALENFSNVVSAQKYLHYFEKAIERWKK